MKNLLCLILSLLLMLPPLPAMAWSECGHHIIAAIAFERLPPERQTELLRILKEHPRFAEDFKIPGNVKNANHWLIGRDPEESGGVGLWELIRKPIGLNASFQTLLARSSTHVLAGHSDQT